MDVTLGIPGILGILVVVTLLVFLLVAASGEEKKATPQKAAAPKPVTKALAPFVKPEPEQDWRDRDTGTCHSDYTEVKPYLPTTEVPMTAVAADKSLFDAIPVGNGKTASGDRPRSFPDGSILELVERRDGVVLVRCFPSTHKTSSRTSRYRQMFLMPTERFIWLAQQQYRAGHWAHGEYDDELRRREAQKLLDFLHEPQS